MYAFPGNQIPANRINPIALRYLALLPGPTTSGLANNYQSTTTFTERTNTADVRLDHRINASNTIWGRWSYNGLNTVTPSACPVDTATGINPGCYRARTTAILGPNKTRAAGYQANYVRVFSPTLVGEFKGGLLDLSIGSFAANDAAGKSNLSAAFGIPGVNVDDIATGLSLMNMTGFAVLGDTQNLPLVNKNFTKQFSAVLTKTAGAHSFKIGGGVIMREVSNTQSSSPNGIFAFNANLTRSTTGAGGHSVASFLLGVPTTVHAEPRAVHAVLPQQRTVRLHPGRLARDPLVDRSTSASATTSRRRLPRKTICSPTWIRSPGRSTWPAGTAPRERPA